MASFSFSGFGFSSITKISFSLLATLLVTYAGVTALRSWWQPSRALPAAPVAVNQTPSPAPLTSPEPQDGDIQQVQGDTTPPTEPTEETVPRPAPVVVANPLAGVKFFINYDEDKHEFNDWKEASNFIKNVEPLGSSDSDESESDSEEERYNLSLKVEFDSSSLTPYINENEFRIWLSHLGAYIFALRIDLFGDLSPVLRNTKGLVITKSSLVHKRGCAQFKSKNGKWIVRIKGLEDHPEELRKILKNVLVKALKKPEKIAKLAEMEVSNFSDALANHDLTLNKDQQFLVEYFVDCSTLSKKMKGIKNNQAAIMPLINFTTINEQLEKYNINFITYFHQNIVSNIFKDLPGNYDSIEQILSEQTAYNTLIAQLVDWRERSDIATLLLSSLFTDNNR